MHPVLNAVKGRIGAKAFLQWFSQAEIVECDSEICKVSVPNSIHQLWIETNFSDVLRSALFETLEAHPVIKFVAAEADASAPAVDPFANPPVSTKSFVEAVNKGTVPHLPATGSMSEKEARRHRLNSTFTFDNFVEGQSSRFALAAARAVSEERGPGMNPLFIYGDSGLGKTHLLHAIGLERLRRNPKAKVIYISSEEFSNEFISAIQNRKLDKLRAKYRRADLFLLDDVQFLGGKDRSQEEFFHTFNSLFDSQCQIVLTSDCAASEIKLMSKRLVSRFEAGMTCEVLPPRLETREAIVLRKMAEWNVKLAPDVVALLVNRITNNVRRLVGALVRIATYTSLGEGRVTVERAEELLHDILAEDSRTTITIDRIQKLVVEEHDLILADMSSRRRPAHIAFPRQIAMYLSRKLTSSSLIHIGDSFGGRDHGTVLHAVKQVTKKMRTDPNAKAMVDRLMAKLQR